VGAKGSLPANRSAWWVLRPALVILPLLLLVGLLFYVAFAYFVTTLATEMLTILTLLCLLPFALISVFWGMSTLSWWRAASVAKQPAQAHKAALACNLTALGLVPFVWFPFALWALGTIPAYETAQSLALLSAILSLIWGLRRVGRYSRASKLAPEN